MSQHSCTRCWLHMVWTTLKRERVLNEQARARVCGYLSEYAETKGIYLKIAYVNEEHVHALIDLPTRYSMEDVAHLFKGSSSHWINENRVVPCTFAWGRGYGAFSVSQTIVPKVAGYIARQGEHHKLRSFQEEYEYFVKVHGLKFHDDE